MILLSPVRNLSYASLAHHIRLVETLGWSQERERAVLETILPDDTDEFRDELETMRSGTWMDWANIIFQRADRGEDADIRIAFEPGSSWKAVGEGAKRISKDKPTLNLSWLKDQKVRDEVDRGTILHEFGRALG